jgi:hypothetical protein
LEAAGRNTSVPRVVFLTHTQRVDAAFAKAVFELIGDSSVDDLAVYVVLESHLPFVRDHRAELRRLNPSESRMQVIKRALDKATDDKGTSEK